MSASELSSPPEENLKRRGAMVGMGMIAALAVSYGTAAIYGLRYLFGRQKAPRKIPVLVAAFADVPEGGSLLKEDLSGQKFLLVRSGENIRAFSTACTHLGCQVHWKPGEKTFFCPCHDGVFDADGNPVSGPPPSPLAQKPVKIRGSSIFVSMDEV
ncbi:MAG: Rieske (2Fe-2S) protein [Nitrospinota bacterium]|nr:Rieske (2Fe-2S) protein [Nitrospinota bacterium]